MNKIKILLVDDVKFDLASYNKCFADDSYEKKFAQNGEEAVMIYHSWQPDIIILDLVMPVKTGYVALKEIRKIEKNLEKKVCIIVVSSLNDKQDVVDCAKVGIQGYITKPINSFIFEIKVLDYYNELVTLQNQTSSNVLQDD